MMKARRSKHGMSFTRPYRIWLSMRQRCEDPNLPNFQRYGAKGVCVCRRWQSFVLFWADMKSGYAPRLQLDRKKNSLGYSKSNCRWVTPRQNSQNRTNTPKIWTPRGRMALSEAARVFGFKFVTLQKRLGAGWPEKDLLLPVGQQSRYSRYSTLRRA